ncbi:hypothetical protein PIN31009_00291 [Pandoraea iniqua]|uniref:hypothetical protein n=1 Tax=Pandoraea iniqua TaxID=2508288 RepID=UPI001240C9E7|nr:hypothetical protein [Pandoraea iniqua]VVD64747.1 hypothetical protein PIN31009_00291 [Pandoraea iniqua]
MASIHTQINAATLTRHEAERLHRLICRHAIDPARTTIGVNHDGYLMLLIGWTAYRHPRQWRRAHEMLVAAQLPCPPGGMTVRPRGFARLFPNTRATRLDQPHVLVWLLRNATAGLKDRMLQRIGRHIRWRDHDSLCSIEIAGRCLPHDALSELKLRMGSAQSITGLYKRLTARGSPYREQFHRELSTSRDRKLWVSRQTVLRGRNGALLPASVIHVAGRRVAVACQAPGPADIERHLELLMTLRPNVVVHVTAHVAPDSPSPAHCLCAPPPDDGRKRQIRIDTRHIATSAAATCMTDFSLYATTLKSASREATFAVLHAPYRHAPEVAADKLYVTQTLQFIEDATRHVPPPAAPHDKTQGPAAGGAVIVFDDTDGIAGVLIAAIALYAGAPGQCHQVSVEEAITDIRLTGSPQLIGSAHQIDVIGAFADDLRLPLLKDR